VVCSVLVPLVHYIVLPNLDNRKFVLQIDNKKLLYFCVHDLDALPRAVLSDEEGNINPYATFPFSRSDASPPGYRPTSLSAAERRPLNATVAANDRHCPTPLHTVRYIRLASLRATYVK